MGWDRDRYYTRSKKVNGRVVREYFGTGHAAEFVALIDDQERERRRHNAAILRDEKSDLTALEADIKALFAQIELVLRAAMLANGYRQYKRGEWRKRRGSHLNAEPNHRRDE
jgi:hypothetical protein